MEDTNKNLINTIIQYMLREKPEGQDWNEVDKKIYFSRIVCCLCTLNERFAYEVDGAVDQFLNEQKNNEKCPTEYGDILIEINSETNNTYVCLAAEPYLTKFEEKR